MKLAIILITLILLTGCNTVQDCQKEVDTEMLRCVSALSDLERNCRELLEQNEIEDILIISYPLCTSCVEWS